MTKIIQDFILINFSFQFCDFCFKFKGKKEEIYFKFVFVVFKKKLKKEEKRDKWEIKKDYKNQQNLSCLWWISVQNIRDASISSKFYERETSFLESWSKCFRICDNLNRCSKTEDETLEKKRLKMFLLQLEQRKVCSGGFQCPRSRRVSRTLNFPEEMENSGLSFDWGILIKFPRTSRFLNIINSHFYSR